MDYRDHCWPLTLKPLLVLFPSLRLLCSPGICSKSVKLHVLPKGYLGMVKPYYQEQGQLELISGPVQQPLLCFSSTWVSAFSSFLSSLPLQGEDFSVQSSCRTRAQLDLANQAPQKHSSKAELQRLSGECYTGSPRGRTEDAHMDLGYREMLSAWNRRAAEPLRERQARKNWVIWAPLRLAHLSRPLHA